MEMSKAGSVVGGVVETVLAGACEDVEVESIS